MNLDELLKFWPIAATVGSVVITQVIGYWDLKVQVRRSAVSINGIGSKVNKMSKKNNKHHKQLLERVAKIEGKLEGVKHV